MIAKETTYNERPTYINDMPILNIENYVFLDQRYSLIDFIVLPVQVKRPLTQFLLGTHAAIKGNTL